MEGLVQLALSWAWKIEGSPCPAGGAPRVALAQESMVLWKLWSPVCNPAAASMLCLPSRVNVEHPFAIVTSPTVA